MSHSYRKPSQTSGEPAVQRSVHLPPGPREIVSGNWTFAATFGSQLPGLTSANSKAVTDDTPYFGRYTRLPMMTGGDHPMSPGALLARGRNRDSPPTGR